MLFGARHDTNPFGAVAERSAVSPPRLTQSAAQYPDLAGVPLDHAGAVGQVVVLVDPLEKAHVDEPVAMAIGRLPLNANCKLMRSTMAHMRIGFCQHVSVSPKHY